MHSMAVGRNGELRPDGPRFRFKGFSLSLLLLVCALGISGANAQLMKPSVTYYHVMFVSLDVGWLYGSGRILATTDGGRSWALWRASNSPGAAGHTPMEMQLLSGQHGWVLYSESQLHRTVDGGHTWQVIDVRPRGPDADPPYRADLNLLRMLTPQVGFGMNHSGDILLRMMDGGLTWRTSRFRQEQADFDELYFLDTKRGWVGGNGEIYATSDGGQVWHALPKASVDGPYRMQFLSSARGWLLDYPSGRLFRTDTGGQNWQQCGSGQSTPKIYGFFFRTPTEGWAAAAGGNVLLTLDGCGTWSEVQASATSVALQDVHFLDERNGWAVGSGDTVLKTTDGGLTWTPVQVNVP